MDTPHNDCRRGQPVSGAARVSLVIGILGVLASALLAALLVADQEWVASLPTLIEAGLVLVMVGSIPTLIAGLVCGHVARADIRRGKRRGARVAFWGLLLCYLAPLPALIAMLREAMLAASAAAGFGM